MGQGKWAIACALLIVVANGRLHAHESASSAPTPAEAEQRIEETLDLPLKSPLDFPETPLNTVITAISEEYRIPIQFDRAALEAVAQSPDAEVTINIGNVTLRSALELMLKQVDDVTYVIDNEVLLVTTEDEAASRLEVRVYRVDDFLAMMSVKPPKGGASAWANYSPLIDVLTSCVEPHSWSENGTGEGEIRQMRPGILVIAQTERVHRRIESLLADLRQVKLLIEVARNDSETPFDDF